ncbi:MAG: hypothetical protein ACJ76F_02780 [Bacteroidia bacterium]
MLYQLDQYLSNSLTKVFEPAIGQRVKYTPNTGSGLISTANTNLNGTGTIVNILVSTDLSVSSGTFIETVTIQAIGNTTRGMVRLFVGDGELILELIAEVDIPSVTVSSVDKAFSITLQTDFMLQSNHVLSASTEKAESFIVIAEGFDTAWP